MIRRTGALALFTALLACAFALSAKSDPKPAPLKFQITLAEGAADGPLSGRLFVVLGKSGQQEPRLSVGRTGMDAPPVFARDVKDFRPGAQVVIDESAAGFPVENLSKVRAGEYFVQAILDTNRDLKSVNAPGNLYSGVEKARVDPAGGGTINVTLRQKVPPEELPAETEHLRYVKLRSELLSRFHGRPIYLRAGIILPRSYAAEPSRKYPLRVHIGGYGDRFTEVGDMLSPGSEFQRTWSAADAPQMILLHLDGDGPFGDSYQIDSDNNGPYGRALTEELIPYVEKNFRGVGEPYARVLDGGSTGGWVSLALQIFYPDYFNGTWSYCPDGVDFRAFQLVDIYSDKNAYLNRHGFERPSARDLSGDTRFTMRHELQLENVMGAGDSWAMSGGQWGAWNAAYGPRGADGRPVPLWDPKTGEIDQSVLESWKKYDLRLVLEKNWGALAPKLGGKINIWVGEADNYFLNNAVHLLDGFLSKASPPFRGRIAYGPGKGHCWLGLTQRQMMDEMLRAVEQGRSVRGRG
ncbi:MAG TPA: alpha/beta hydrolase-fold protein [Blastocatellia bacterium]|nr:alpha/beta hydrolase-fold protein [Blastocatellia bacterium]